MSSKTSNGSAKKTYSYLGPIGTFTELALAQVAEAKGAIWHPVSHVQEAIDDVLAGRAFRAIIPVENSVEGGVTATSDALAVNANIRIYGEYLVPVTFDLVARPGATLSSIKTVATHPVAYAQTRSWLSKNLSKHIHLPATSTAAAAADLLQSDAADAAIAATTITKHYKLKVLAKNIGDNKNAQTRFLQIGLANASPAKATGKDKTSVIVELPTDRPGALLEMLEQFATRGVNLSRIESRPIGDQLGRYRFNIDIEGHVQDAAVAEALKGLHRFSPKVIFLGSYARADKKKSVHEGNNTNVAFAAAEKWIAKL
ncbi:MAG: prephenate dehydratase [Actinobacteria bacterium]|uniref:prephenate dehydratase n=1 Tax=freshwater metagenome TaxID=449393 RepID=A0A6J6I001_9ZZZZ|nr:prephenate dehydratase [Actinomycetota bacterium]